MNPILDNANIKFDFSWTKGHIAKVTLNFENSFEVRFFRITMREDGSLYFQPPAIQVYGWKNCFIVLDKKEWNEFSNKILHEFDNALIQQEEDNLIPLPFLEKLKSFKEQNITEEDLDVITKELDKKQT